VYKIKFQGSAIRAVSVAVALAFCAPAVAAPARDAAASYTFAFQEADIAQVAQAILGDALGLSYTIDPGVTGKMSFRIDRRLTGAQLLAAFEAALNTSDVAIVREGDAITLEPRAKAKGSGRLRMFDEGVHSAGYQTVAVPLAYAAPSEVAKAMAATGRSDMIVDVDDKLGLLILGGTGPEIEAAVELIRTFDHSGLEDSKIRFFELEQAPADTVSHDLNQVLDASGITGVTVVPLKRMNGLFVFARTAQALDEVGKWVEKLDVPSKEKTATLWVYHPKNATAESLASTLNSALTGQFNAPSAPPAPSAIGAQIAGPLSGPVGPMPALSSSPPLVTGPTAPDDDPVRVGLDKEANTILIFASASRWLQIQKILEQIDEPPGQVLIEASIIEVDLTKNLNFGVDWAVVGANGQLGISSINNVSGTVGQIIPGFSVTFLGKNVQAAIHALGTDSSIEVISAPKIIVLDNHVAKLDVGDQLPVITQTGQDTTTPGAPVINSVNYVNTGVILNVTPRIGDGKVYLDIDQEVSAGTVTTSSGIDSPTISTRKVQTTLALEDGGVVALGGLISSNKTFDDSGLPYVKNIPVLGLLFKSTKKATTRNELIVLIKADIIRDKASSQHAMTDLLADMHEIERRGLIQP
jgi:general secretion pathway protein D